MKQNVAAVVLAAGLSRRMGQPKQLLRIGTRTLLRRITEEALASSVGSTFVVAGAARELMRAELESLPVIVVENTRFADGIGTSISAGVAEVERLRPETDALVLLACDQPHVSVSLIDRLLSVHTTTEAPLVASAYAGTLGIPALFARSYFPALLELPPDRGAKEILLRHRDRVVALDFEEGAVDLDTMRDYEQWAETRRATS